MIQVLQRSKLLILIPLAFIAACSASRNAAVPHYPKVTVKNFGPTVNSSYDDFAPVVFSGGQRLWFTSNRPTTDGVKHGDDFWESRKQQPDNWTNAINLSNINTDKDEGGVCISADGKTIFFVQCKSADGFGDADIYTATINDDRLEKIKNLGKGVNTKYWDSMPYLSADGTELFFASDRPGGYGGTDIYVAKLLRDGGWGEPKNLGPEINSSGDEKSPLLSPNGEMLYFASNGRGGVGGFDIFVSKLVKNKWTAPKNAGTPINSPEDDLYFSLSAEEDTLYISSKRDDGYGRFDLWMADNNPFKDSTLYEYFVTGRVVDSISLKTITNATLNIENKSTGEQRTLHSGAGGQFRFQTRPGAEYKIKVNAKEYKDNIVSLEVPKRLSYSEYRRNLSLMPIITAKKDTIITPFIVYFDFDKSDLRGDQLPVLDRATIETKKYNTSELFLDAHTDDMGTEEYNMDLSQRRGASVSKYFSTHGIPVEWISITPHGKTQPVAPNDTEEGRQKNRRVEIRIQGNNIPMQ